MKKERRNHPRRPLTNNDMFVLDRCSEKVAVISDLGAGGMQLRYSPEDVTCLQWTLVDVFTVDQYQIIIPGLACKTVYDVAGLMESGSFSGEDVRICGVCFDALTGAQQESLQRLLESGATA